MKSDSSWVPLEPIKFANNYSHRPYLCYRINVPVERVLSLGMDDCLGGVRWAARVRGLIVVKLRLIDSPPRDLLDLSRLVVAVCDPMEPTPGYDADGRECWEYPP